MFRVCFHSPLKKMVVGMLLASMAFVAAAFVQLEIDVRTALCCSTNADTHRLFDSITTVSFLENSAKFPSSLGEPSEVHQHAGQKN